MGVFLISEIVVHPVLLLLHTPDHVIELTLIYIRLFFAGDQVIAAYNIFAAILRALGNGKSPLTAMIVAAVVNIGLDLLFVAVFEWGVAGATIATVIAQGVSAIYCFLVLRKISDVKLRKEDFYSQSGMNLRLLEMAAISYGYAITIYVGQNRGAGKYERIRKGVRSGTFMALATAVFISAIMIFCGRNILGLFVSGDVGQVTKVLAIAYKYLFIMAIFLWVLYLLYVYRSAIQGLGNTWIPLVSGIAEFCMRVGVALILPKFIGENGIFYAEICAWSGAAVLLILSYGIIIQKYKK